MIDSVAVDTGALRYSVLVVDDEVKICDLLRLILQTSYDVKTAGSVEQAKDLIGEGRFDLVCTDLRLPDGSGIDVLKHAKTADQSMEVIIITGYASLDTATAAINLGATSYLTKPISNAAFLMQVRRALANREFYFRSRRLVDRTEALDTSSRNHLWSITTIYDVSRKLMLTLDIADIMRTILLELNDKLHAEHAVLGVCLFGESEVFAMPRFGLARAEELRKSIDADWDALFGMLDPSEFVREKISFMPFDGVQGPPPAPMPLQPQVAPLIALGKTIGSIAVFKDLKHEVEDAEYQFLHVFASLIAPLVENGYVHKRTMSQATTDPLTGVFNRRSFNEMLMREMARTEREKNEFCFAMIDIDDFKRVNDVYGHLVGDAVLKDLAARVNEKIRFGDVFARYGGEEFAIILPNTSPEGALALAERIRKNISSVPYEFYEKSIVYSISIGLAMFNGRTPCKKDELIRAADEALYVSKREGKNRVSIKKADLLHKSPER
jgi:two-component system, cell cycle response regulator